MKRFTGRDKILLLLPQKYKYMQVSELPSFLTQKGIAERVDLSRNRVSKLLKELKKEGLVNEEKSKVENSEYRCKVYFLTEKGASRREDIKEEKVKVKTEEMTFETSLDNIEEHVGVEQPLIHALNNIDQGTIDLTDRTYEDVSFGPDHTVSLKIN